MTLSDHDTLARPKPGRAIGRRLPRPAILTDDTALAHRTATIAQAA